MKTLNKTLSTLAAGAALLGTATFAIVATPNQDHPAFASFAAPEAGNSFVNASYAAPEAGNSFVHASYVAPEAGNSFVNASYRAPEAGNSFVNATYRDPEGNHGPMTEKIMTA